MTARERKLRALLRQAMVSSYLRGCAEVRAELAFKARDTWQLDLEIAKVHRRAAREAARQARELVRE